MSDQIRQQLDNLEAAVVNHQTTVGEDMVRNIVPAVDDLAAWIDHFRSISKSGTALELLDGAHAASLEVITYAFFGLGRAAITAIRLQIDMVLGYTYFKDHPVEWETVKGTGEGYMLFRDINKHHGEVDSKFWTRIGYLNNRPYRSLQNIYHILSAHIHGQSPYTLPSLGPLESIVLDVEMMDSIIELQRQSITALSYHLVAVYAGEWPQLPEKFVTQVSNLLSRRQRPLFFSA